MVKYPPRKCAVCGQKLTAKPFAAEWRQGVQRKTFCIPCWDSPDEVALKMYQMAGIAQSNFSPGDSLKNQP